MSVQQEPMYPSIFLTLCSLSFSGSQSCQSVPAIVWQMQSTPWKCHSLEYNHTRKIRVIKKPLRTVFIHLEGAGMPVEPMQTPQRSQLRFKLELPPCVARALTTTPLCSPQHEPRRRNKGQVPLNTACSRHKYTS